MGLSRVGPGKGLPDEVNVIIEIPAHSDPIKYEVDKETGAIFIDRFMSTSMRYPCDYGYIPNTLSEDGDPVDVLMLSPFPLSIGTVLRCRPVGMLKMTDEAGADAKILAVPVNDISGLYSHIHSPNDCPQLLIDQISHFFSHYKDLEEGKFVKIDAWVGADEAKQEIIDSVKRFENAPDQPAF